MAALKDEWMVGVASIVYLAIFFCPGDLVYKLVKQKLIYVVICTLKEILRAKKVYKGLEEGKSAMPAGGSVFFIPVLIATLKVGSTCLVPNSEIKKNGFLKMKFLKYYFFRPMDLHLLLLSFDWLEVIGNQVIWKSSNLHKLPNYVFWLQYFSP